MPLALDLISTLVMGSILPVATTLFARSPFSTLASLEGSILVPLLDAISAPATTRITTAAAIELQIMIRLRRFFLPLPLPSTTASCLIPNLRTSFICCYARHVGIVPQKNCCRDGACPVSRTVSYQGVALAVPQVSSKSNAL